MLTRVHVKQKNKQVLLPKAMKTPNQQPDYGAIQAPLSICIIINARLATHQMAGKLLNELTAQHRLC
jgi:hypothetical protein